MPVGQGPEPTYGNVNPVSQTINWTRGTLYPAITRLKLDSTNAETVDVEVQFIGTSVEWISFEGYSGQNFILTDFQTGYLLNINAQNLELLVNNNYKVIINFRFKKYDGPDKVIDAEINLAIAGSYGIQADNEVYNVIFNRANNQLSGDVTVGLINNTEGKLLTFDQPEIVFEPKTGFTAGFTIEDNQSQSIAVNPNIPTTGSIDYPCRILGPIGEFIDSFTIHLTILDDNGIGVSPEQLSFEVIKNTTEKTAVLSIINPFNIAFTAESSDWLELSATSGNASVDIDVTTSTDLLAPGNHTGFVNIIFEGGSITVPIDLLLKQFIILDETGNTFCLDQKPVRFTLITESAVYVRVTMKATYVVLGAESVVEQVYIIPYIDDKASLELGKKLHSYFPRVRKELFTADSSIEYMKAVDCDLIVEELDINYEPVLTENVDGLRYFAGSKPAMFPILTNYGFRKKNFGSELYISHIEGDTVKLEKMLETAGDQSITYSNKTVNIYQFPKAFRPIHMHWENQNLVPEWFTFTGDYTIAPDYTHIASKNILNSLMEKFETTKVKKLTINTGFMMQHEIDMMEEIIMSRLAFIKIQGKIYQCYNATAKLNLNGSAEDIISRDLEFIIVEK